jgi:hypothetical protein
MWLLLACSTPVEPSNSDLIPGAPDGGPDEDTESEDSGEPYVPDTDEPIVDEQPQPIVFNEVMPKNRFAFTMEGGGHPDFIELFNAGFEAVALDRVTVSDGSGRVWMGIEGNIEPGGWYLLYADEGEGADHAPFTLDGSGDELTIQVDGWVTDRMATGEMDADVAWARFPDGGAWAPTIWITAGESNGSAPSDDLNTDNTMFGLYGVHTVNLVLDTSDLSSLRSAYTTYVEGDIEIDGSLVESVGVRLRGSSTLRTIDQKCSFKVDFDRYEDQRFRGAKKIHLINMIWDPAHIREYVSYYMFVEFGVAAVRNAYAWVTVNDSTEKGLYLYSEVYDDEFLEYWYGTSDGYLWEPGSGDFTSGASYWDCEEGYPCDASVIDPVADLMRSSATDANVEAMEEVLDLEEALRMIAVEIAVGQWDGYCSPHNYRVFYNAESGLISMMPSSVDLTFDNLGYSYGHNYYSCGGGLLAWCLSNDTCSDRYDDILLELADRIEGDDEDTSFQLTQLLDDIEVLIDDYAVDDAATGLSGYTYVQHQASFAAIRQYLIDEPERIRDQVAAH